MLSPEEQKTLEAYKIISKGRNKTHANPDFWRPEFEKFRKLLPTGKVVDIGCGGGRDALLFTQFKEYEYTGTDISEDMLLGAKELVPQANFQTMDMYNLDFAPQSLDGFWAAASLLHIPKRNLATVLQEIKRVTKPKGIGFIAIKEGNGEKMVQGTLEGDERFFSFYNDEGFSKSLEDNGFTILERNRDMREYNPPKNLTVWLLYFVRVN